MTNKPDKIEKLLTQFYREENSRPIPSDFKSNVLAEARKASQKTPLESWLDDNLWIVLVGIVTVGFAAYFFFSNQTFPRFISQKELVTSFVQQRSIWIELAVLLASGLFVYLTQILNAKDQTDYS